MQRAATVSQIAALVSGFDPGPAYRGLADALRVVITDGRVPVGVRLPSERQLTTALGVSRTTVARAYAELRDHGFLASRQGSGWVTMLPQARGRRGDHLLPVGDQPHGKIDLTMAAHAADPCILAAYRRAVDQLPGYLAGAGYHPAGLPELREAVASSFADRGLPTDPDQIVITAGALAAVAIAARALVRPGTRVLLESPTYPNAIATFESAGARVSGIDAGHADSGQDDFAQVCSVPEGSGPTWAGDVSAAAEQLRPAAAYLVPDFHNPTGALRSAGERQQVADALGRAGTTAVIDESFVMLNLDGIPMPDPFACHHEDTLTVGSLSKSFWGGLRVGWLRVPAPRMDAVVRVRLSLDLGAPVLEQLAATRLLEDRHLRGQQLRDRLRASRDTAIAALARHLPDWSVWRPPGGLSLWCRLPEARSSALVAKAEGYGVLLAAGPEFAPEGGLDRFVRIPYSEPEEILEDAIERLAAAWRDTLGDPATPRRARTVRGSTALVS
jgi:DNA-binding transcriptional MocR family regulator